MEVINLASIPGPVCVQSSLAGLVVAGQTAAPSSGASAAPASSAEAGEREQGFKPDKGGANLQSGELLLIEAYAAIWLMAFGLILHTWRKQRLLATRLDQLQRDIARERDRDDGGPEGSSASE
ncbi:MAG: hypothetical protein JRI68_27875 [Deltaproteobacteria bacterium]|nr:hypothetical protein [Deltaproteobacteria bacterium]